MSRGLENRLARLERGRGLTIRDASDEELARATKLLLRQVAGDTLSADQETELERFDRRYGMSQDRSLAHLTDEQLRAGLVENIDRLRRTAADPF